MRRLEAERIDEVPAGNRRWGWGRRCGLGASNSARQPPSMACGASRRSGVAPARRASHARTREVPGLGFLVILCDSH